MTVNVESMKNQWNRMTIFGKSGVLLLLSWAALFTLGFMSVFIGMSFELQMIGGLISIFSDVMLIAFLFSGVYYFSVWAKNKISSRMVI